MTTKEKKEELQESKRQILRYLQFAFERNFDILDAYRQKWRKWLDSDRSEDRPEPEDEEQYWWAVNLEDHASHGWINADAFGRCKGGCVHPQSEKAIAELIAEGLVERATSNFRILAVRRGTRSGQVNRMNTETEEHYYQDQLFPVGSPRSVALTRALATKLREKCAGLASPLYDLTWEDKFTPLGFVVPTHIGKQKQGSVIKPWPTPIYSDYKGANWSGNGNGSEHMLSAVAWDIPLETVKSQLPNAGIPKPLGGEDDGRRKASLNPSHCRWLMGLPPEWDECGIKALGSLPRKKTKAQARVLLKNERQEPLN